MIGTIINSTSIAVGSLLGMKLKSGLSSRQTEAVRTVVGLVTVLIGVNMFSRSAPVLTVLLSLAIGAVVGELIDLDGRLDAIGARLKKATGGGSGVAGSFYASTLLFAVGPMAMLGPIHEAVSGDLSILLTKSVLDGVCSVAMSASLGIGVMFSSVSVLIYQGIFYVVGLVIGEFMPASIVSAMTSTGGALILAIGLNLLGVAKIRVGNMLPALVVAAVIALFVAF